MVCLISERLLLREFVKDDFQQVHEYATDPKVVRFMEWGPNTRENTKNFIGRAIKSQKENPRRNYTLAITLKEEKTLIGGCKVYISNISEGEGEIGYCLNRCYWKQGYATETAKNLLKFGFSQLKLKRLFATCDVENTSSENVLRKIGMTLEKKIQKHKIIRGIWHDSYLYSTNN
jgi:RimJ/RimL family protein N-acetyltransferase